MDSSIRDSARRAYREGTTRATYCMRVIDQVFGFRLSGDARPSAVAVLSGPNGASRREGHLSVRLPNSISNCHRSLKAAPCGVP